MESFFQDCRYALRTLARSPEYVLVAVAVLALGIGATTAMFSVIRYSLLEPAPYPQSDRMVMITEKSPSFPEMSVAWLNYVDWRKESQSFSELAAFRRDSFNLTGVETPERLGGRMVSANLFALLKTGPALGRAFTEEEDRPGGEPVVILADSLWRSHFGADPTVLGRSITLNRKPFTIVGVMGPDFRFLRSVDLFVPIGQWGATWTERDSHPGITVVGRLKPGVTEAQARADLEAVAARLSVQYPDSNANNGINLVGFKESITQDVQTGLLILLGAVAFVLLIASANVANLMLARATSRQREMAIRVAMGAGRLRLVSQLLTESVILSALGGALGVLLAMWGVEALSSLIPESLPRSTDIRIDGMTLAFSSITALMTGILFGLFPALHVSSTAVHPMLKGGNASPDGSRHRMRSMLVVAEVALSLVLLIGAGLLLQSFSRLASVQPGFDVRNALTLQLALSEEEYAKPGKLAMLEGELRRKISEIPGVKGVAASTGLPLDGQTETGFNIVGRETPPNAPSNMTVLTIVTDSYFDMMGIPLLKGRSFTAADTHGPLVAVIDEQFAKDYFKGEEPVGQRIQGPPGQPTIEIVGVVGHVQQYNLDGKGPVNVQLYYPYGTVARIAPEQIASGAYVVVKAESDPRAFAPAVRQAVLSIDKDQPVFDVKTMGQVLEESIATQRFSMLLLSIFSVLALVLATAGIYGVMSYAVAQRTREIGIRVALGAQRKSVVGLMLGHGATLAGIGIAIGLVGAFVLSRLMASLVFGVSTFDPMTYGGLSLILAAVALLASYVPARRAVRVDPVIALRAE